MTTAENHLIAALPPADQRRLLALCEPAPLVLTAVLSERGTPARHVYFPTQGFISLVKQIDHHPGLEVGMVGREGLLGSQLALGVATATARAVVQGDGMAWRVSRIAFAHELASSAALRKVLQRYVYVLMAQLTTSAGCVRFHQIGPRLARWLLMSQDRAGTQHFHVTQDFLGYMLGVRRVGVTLAAVELQRAGLIAYHRGELTVLDRPGLEAAACSCYAADLQTYRAQLGSLQ